MKKMALILMVFLLSSSVWATEVTITCTDEGGGIVRIDYAASGSPKVRAFALDIMVDKGTIDQISNFKKGESVTGDKGYGIFPANFSRYINVDPNTGQVTTWDVSNYTPVADANDLNALGGLGTNGITIEMGAIYFPADDSSPNAPDNAGTLCKIKVSESANVSVSENATRGGVVLTDPSVDPIVITIGCPVTLNPLADNSSSNSSGCFPGSFSTYSDWVALGKPACWCSKYQCDGDADGKTSGFPFNYRVFTADLALVVDNWKKTINDPTLNPCADIDHKDSGFPFRYRVYTADLAKIVTNWKKTDADLPGDCPRSE
ncbi:MAG: hypothetical protein A2167_02990 [Planctomycetes bacterium RBG_13_46_10]|nr:MAG: hypothetical protein A2167_02990 [Planctomycetes bacterium RBG_13_46_10]